MADQTNRFGHLVDNFFLLFVGLRLAEIITWSWWWVTAPLWGSLLIGFLVAFGQSWHKQTKRQKWIKMKQQKAERDGQSQPE